MSTTVTKSQNLTKRTPDLLATTEQGHDQNLWHELEVLGQSSEHTVVKLVMRLLSDFSIGISKDNT